MVFPCFYFTASRPRNRVFALKSLVQSIRRNLKWADFQVGKDDNAPTEDTDCLDCQVNTKPLDLSDVPTEKALRCAGAEDGALHPMRCGDVGELGIKLDRLLKWAGIEGGLSDELSPRDPRFRALKRGKERYERARAINDDPPKTKQPNPSGTRLFWMKQKIGRALWL